MNSETVAVLGSGTMGAGIAQAALAAGLPVVLYDVSAPALGRAQERIAAGLAKQGAPDAAARLTLATGLEQIAGAALVVEAAPEQLDLKRELFGRVGALCPTPAVIASNTSSLPIAALAGACPEPQRVAGLHFFNPVHRMALVEVVRAPRTDDATIATLIAFTERLGKRPVLTRDTPGFIVNRVARPFYTEALRLLGDGVAPHDAIDDALRLAGGFPLGPFALMDLIGIDINFAVTSSLYEQSFGEPRYRPHHLQQQKVLQGDLGRKTGRGFYDYHAEGEKRSGGEGEKGSRGVEKPSQSPISNLQSPTPGGRILVGGGSWAPGLAGMCETTGLAVTGDLPGRDEVGPQAAFVVAGRDEGAVDQVMTLDRRLPPSVPILAQCADVMACELAALLDHPERLVGFDGLFSDGVLTLVATPLLSAETRAAADELARGLGRRPLWIADSPALIVPRVIAMLANEAAFAAGEGVADAATIDLALRLGANHPIGPLARAEALGYARVVALLDHLRAELGEERYRVAPALRRAARVGRM